MAMRNDAELDWTKRDCPVTVYVLDQTDRLADQSGADVDRVTLPLDLAVVANPPDDAVTAVLRLAQHAVPQPWRDTVVLSGRVVAERLVRTLVVVKALEVLEALQLLAQRAC